MFWLNLSPSHLCVCPVCKEAKADLVFLVDGSWSIGDDNFMKITRFLYSTMGSLDLIGPDGTQVRPPCVLFPTRLCSESIEDI